MNDGFGARDVAQSTESPGGPPARYFWRPMPDLTRKQLGLLKELVLYGGTLIISRGEDKPDYLVLQRLGLLKSFALNGPLNEILYEITDRGREAAL